MGLLSAEYKDRLEHWIRTLKQDLYRPLGEISFEGFTTMDQLSPEQANAGNYQPIPVGYQWGHTYEYLWLRGQVQLPEEARDKMICMSLDLSGEATLFVNGQEFGTRRAEWVSVPHHYIQDNILSEAGVPGRQYYLLFEVYAGHFFPGCDTGPVMPGAYQDPTTEGARTTVGKSTYGIWNEDAYQLYMDVSTLKMLLDELPEDSLRAAKVAEALEQFTLRVDFEQDEAGRDEDYRACRQYLKPVMAAHNGATAPRMVAVGNAHLDLAWLWPMAETYRKTARTFAQQLRLLEKYPEYRFIQSQPASYDMCKKYYPKLFARIKEAIKAGHWIADGAMYVEPDTNMASGEALIRQLIHGKRFYQDELGVESRMLWLPDTFGYTAALPQILKSCGVDYLVTQKIFWSYNEGDRFPYHYFTWKGMDGSSIQAFLPTSYTYRTDPTELNGIWKNRVQKRDLDAFLMPFGYGDGGGGPCRDYIEYAIREKDLEGLPKVEMAHPVKLFKDLDAEGGPENTWDGELYFSAHRGVYTSQAKVKRNNRRSELALREAELWGALASDKDWEYPLQEMDRLWKVLLLHQFHDILPGSSIARVYAEANQQHEKLQAQVGVIAARARAALTCGDGMTYFNSLSFPRTVRVALPEGMSQAKTLEGNIVPCQDGQALLTLPAMGWVSLVPASVNETVPQAHAYEENGLFILENNQVRAAFDKNGEMVSFRLASGREILKGHGNAFRFYKDVPRLFDAWDIDSHYEIQPVAIPDDARVCIACAHGLQASLTLTRTVGDSTLTQTISLDAHAIRVEFDTTVEWHELHRLLKVAFEGDVRATEAVHEMQFGFVERPNHRSRAYDKDRFEVCNHRYTALRDEGHGYAVLNNCKYGVGVLDSTITLTLLRAAAAPEMRADNGTQHFTYAFCAWEGSFLDSPVVREGLDLNVPVTCSVGAAPAFSAFNLDKTNIILDTVKPAEDGSGDKILRLYEAKKSDTDFTLKLNVPATRASLCNMLEQETQELELVDGCLKLHAAPFKILTIRLH